MKERNFQRKMKSWTAVFLAAVVLVGSVITAYPVSAGEAGYAGADGENEEDAVFSGTLAEDFDAAVLAQMEAGTYQLMPEEPAENPAEDNDSAENDSAVNEPPQSDAPAMQYFAGAMPYHADTQGNDFRKFVDIDNCVIYINGTKYTGDGEVPGNAAIEVFKGAPFSYEFGWSLKEKPNAGDYFDLTLFKVPGLQNTIQNYKDQPAIISSNGRNIRIGTWDLTYNKDTGEYTYHMEFSQYAAAFDNVKGTKKGSGKFAGEAGDGVVQIKDQTIGSITINNPPEKPSVTPNPSPTGKGWAMAQPPLNNKEYEFGKGIKFIGTAAPDLEWRAVYLKELQGLQAQFIEDNKSLFPELGGVQGGTPGEQEQNINISKLTERGGNYIIEDTLDSNQKYFFNTSDSKYKNDAPFFFEIPVMIAGTGSFAVGSVGDANYHSKGDFPDYINGSYFTKITEDTAELNGKTPKEYVKKTPLTWTIVREQENEEQSGKTYKGNKEHLIINIGKLGTINKSEGLVLNETQIATVQKNRIQPLINAANNSIAALNNGSNSPVAELKTKTDTVNALLNTLPAVQNTEAAGGETGNTETPNAEEISRLVQVAQDKINDFNQWYNTYFGENSGDSKIKDLSEPAKAAFEGLELDKALSALEKAEPLLGTKQDYKDWQKHYSNLTANQKFYADNHDQYLKSWSDALTRYQLTQKFYEKGQVYGFVMKYMTKVINTSASLVQNDIRLSTQDTTLDANSTIKYAFDHAISGEFDSGDAVFKKVDSGSDYEKIKNIKGLAGAKFNVYCGVAPKEGGKWTLEKSENHLGCFTGKDASEKGNAYIWSHNKSDHSDINNGLAGAGITDVETDENGILVLQGLKDEEHHFLVETKAPEGYYLDETPIEFQTNQEEVIYNMAPNIARAVKLTKTSSYDGKPVGGAEFELFKENGEKVTKFTKQSITAGGKTTEFYRYDEAGTAKLMTFSNGELNIHGLPAGEYYLQEKAAAPGFVEPKNPEEYHFTLKENLKDVGKENLYQQNGFYYVLANPKDGNIPEPVVNHEETREVTLTKVGENNTPLTGAAFALLRWNGTAEEWQQDPANRNHWKAVAVNGDNSEFPYFKTEAEKLNAADLEESGYTGYLVDNKGKLTFTDIPNGHYALLEVKAPENRHRAENLWYFDVDVSNKNPVKLCWNTDGRNPVDYSDENGNMVPNDLKKGSLKIHKLVAGNNGELEKPFKFTVILTDEQGKPVEGNFNYTFTHQAEGSDIGTPIENGRFEFKSGIMKFELAHEQALTVTGLPVGTKYTVTEAEDPAYSQNVTGGQGTIPDKEVATAIFRNRYKTGLLRLSKNVTGPEAERDKDFDFTLTFLDKQGGNPLPEDSTYKYIREMNGETEPTERGSITLDEQGQAKVQLKAGENLTFFGLPDQAYYTIEETKDEDYTTKVSVDGYGMDESGNDVSVDKDKVMKDGTIIHGTIVDNHRDNVNFNNIRMPDEGSLMIAKFVDCLTPDENKEFTFRITLKQPNEDDPDRMDPVTGDFKTEIGVNDSAPSETAESQEGEKTITFAHGSGEATFKLRHREYLIIKGLPEDAEYEITEDSAVGYECVVGSAAKGTIKDDEVIPVVFNNIHQEGNLIISKEVTGRGGDTNKEFEFTVTLKDANGNPPAKRTYNYTGSSIGTDMPDALDGTLNLDEKGQGTVKLKHGERIVISGLPEGINYEVTEEAVDGYATQVTNGTGTIQDKVESNAQFTNRFRTGQLRVLKTVENGDQTQDFDFKVELTDNTINGEYDEMAFQNGVAVFKLKHGEDCIATGLPAGVGYTVTEGENADYDVKAENAQGTIKDEGIMRAEFMNIGKLPQPGPMVPPTESTNPTDPTVPNKPTEPGKPIKPDKPTGTGQPTDPSKPTDPTKPTDPSTPTDPTQPTNPTDPTDPNAPANPDGFDEPDKPTKPDIPTKPGGSTGNEGTDKPVIPGYPENTGNSDKPGHPEKPEGPENQAKPPAAKPNLPNVYEQLGLNPNGQNVKPQDSSAQTGDDTHLYSMFFLMMTSLSAMILLLGISRKKGAKRSAQTGGK